jgi:hypothetical protein
VSVPRPQPKVLMRRVAVLVTALLAFAVPPPVQAHFLWHADPRDATAEDIIGVRLSTFWHVGTKQLRAYAEFADTSADYHVTFLFDSRGDERADFKLRVLWDNASGGIYSMGLYRSPDRTPVDVDLHAKLDGGTYVLPVWFEIGALRPTRHIRWRVVTQRDGTRYDRAPDAGWFAH